MTFYSLIITQMYLKVRHTIHKNTVQYCTFVIIAGIGRRDNKNKGKRKKGIKTMSDLGLKGRKTLIKYCTVLHTSLQVKASYGA